MNGRTHAMIGGSIVPIVTLGTGMPLPECTVLAVVSAGFSLGPDIDHPDSTISKSLGHTTHLVFRALSASARTMVSSGPDRSSVAYMKMHFPKRDPMHRSLTHTLVFTAAMGGYAYLMGHHRVSVAILALLSVLVCRRLLIRRWQQAFLLGGGFAVVAASLTMPIPADRIALAATAGWLSHVIADACTTSGVPVLWPLKIKGRRWWRLRILGSWLKTGEPKEYLAAIGVVAAMTIPYFLMA